MCTEPSVFMDIVKHIETCLNTVVYPSVDEP